MALGGLTGGNVGAARGSIEIDTSQPQRVPAIMAGVASGIERNMQRIEASTRRAEGGFKDFSRVAGELSGAFGLTLGVAGVAQLARMTVEMARTSAQAERTEDAFENLAAGVGASSDQMLAQMQEAADGMVSDANLILGANRAIASGVADTGDELARILEISRAAAATSGRTTTEAFSRITEALAKLEPELLDELNITVRLTRAYDNYAAQLGTTADKLTETQRRQAMFNELVRQAQPAVEAAGNAADNNANRFDRLGASWDNTVRTGGDLFNEVGVVTGALNALATMLDFVNARWQDAITLIEGFKAAAAGVGNLLGWGNGGPPHWRANMPGPRGRFNEAMSEGVDTVARDKAKLDWSEGIADLNERTEKQILDQRRDYNRQREDAENDYQERTLREAQDFALNRQRQEQDLADNIASIHADATRREKRMAEDLARGIARAHEDSSERIAELTEDHYERLAELEQDYQENREKAAEDHRDKLLSAAGRLDAIAILEERKRWARESKERDDAYHEQRSDLEEQLAERLDDERKALNKSITQQREAHERQLQEAREADALRLAEMNADFEERRRREDQDRAIRLRRDAEDHAEQLAEMERAHQERIGQISRHALDEERQLNEEHDKAMIAAGVRDKELLERQAKREKALMDSWDRVWNHMQSSMGVGLIPGTSGGTAPRIPMYAEGGYVPRTGLAMLHAGEFVMPAPTVAVGGMGWGRNITIEQGAIAIYGAVGQSEERLGMIVEERVVRLLEEMGNN